MKITSFDTDISNRIVRDPLQNDLYDLFQKNIINSQNLSLRIYVVPREFEMRLDRISNFIYGTPDYVEELMVLNNIISPYSVQEGQYIYFCQIEDLSTLYTRDDMTNLTESYRQNTINSAQPNRQNQNLGIDQNLPPTVMPSKLKQITVTQDNKVQIINTF